MVDHPVTKYLSRNEELQDKLCAPGWDLAVFDEAHKLAAHYFGANLQKTGRFRFAEKLGAHVRHLLLMTATPHNGKEADYQLFLSLLDADPHRDVLEGTFQQAEFAADITAVNTGRASREYQDAGAFYERTFITEGMGLLLTQVTQRLVGKGGEPVVQLQTAFGGGKTHTMLAVYHLATRQCALSDLPGIPALIERTGVMDVPTARVAVLDGAAHAPGQPWKRGKQAIKTLWGELAWQLGGADAFALVKDADATGTSPGKDVLCDLLERHAPCIVLMDELVAYIRQFSEGQALSGGSYDSNLSFVQALTEAVKLVPTGMVLASLPESDVGAALLRRAFSSLFMGVSLTGALLGAPCGGTAFAPACFRAARAGSPA